MRVRRFWLTALFLPLAFASAVPADECDPNDPTLLKPDLFALPPADVTVSPLNGHRSILFTSGIGNNGDGPLILHGHTVQAIDGPVTQAIQEIRRTDGTSCTRVAGVFEFHPSHNHFHFEDVNDYQLRRDDPFTGEIVARSAKVSFCMIDVWRLPGVRLWPQVAPNCASAEGTQGISVGFADVYGIGLPGQSIDLEADPNNPVPPGNYFLVNIANPDKLLWEINDDTQANAGIVSITLGASFGRPVKSRFVKPTRTPTQTSTPESALEITPTPTSVPKSTSTPTSAPVGPGPVQGPRPRHPLKQTRPPHAPHKPSVSQPRLALCGGLHHLPCFGTDFCDFPEGTCGVAGVRGQCQPRGEVCPALVFPVCGCDGVTYNNDCERQRAGVPKAHGGGC